MTRRAAQAGIPDITAHDFRHTFISDLLAAGVDIATVQSLAGHESATTTAGYDRRPAAARRAAVDLLAA
ncbi:tyrosine-type recombinase/integrase [Actinocorallia libanotica]|uniref:Tyr recombinase domain-containing protein n=1 Tax=Actinocorallia libanotica TaxID=46162 RepID=A0ABP4CGB9_9ACTN